MGYKKNRSNKKLNDKTTLIHYKRKVKAFKIRFTFLCYFRLNIQLHVYYSKILGLVISKMNKHAKSTISSYILLTLLNA